MLVTFEAEIINKKLALVPLVAILIVLALLLGFGLKGQFVFGSTIAYLVVSILFYWLVTPTVTFISAKGYLNTGSLILLFISLAFFVALPFSIASVVTPSIPNYAVTFAALGFIVSSAFQLAGAVQASFGSVPVGFQNRKLRLFSALAGTLTLCIIIIVFGFLGFYPPFFLQNIGTTFIDYLFYAFSIFFFASSGLLYLRLYFKSKSEVLYFYSLALILYAIGAFGITQQVVFGDAVVWVGRTATYIGLLYFLYALIVSRKETIS